MKKLFNGKKETMVYGVLYLKKVTLDQLVDDLVYINTMLGNDIYETSLLANAISNGMGTAVRVPIATTEKIWKKLKKSGKVNLIASTEKKLIENEMEMGIALV